MPSPSSSTTRWRGPSASQARSSAWPVAGSSGARRRCWASSTTAARRDQGPPRPHRGVGRSVLHDAPGRRRRRGHPPRQPPRVPVQHQGARAQGDQGDGRGPRPDRRGLPRARPRRAPVERARHVQLPRPGQAHGHRRPVRGVGPRGGPAPGRRPAPSPADSRARPGGRGLGPARAHRPRAGHHPRRGAVGRSPQANASMHHAAEPGRARHRLRRRSRPSWRDRALRLR